MSRQFKIESLEPRQLLSAVSINYENFASTGHLAGNGFGASAITTRDQLQLTSGLNHQARSVFYDTAVPISNFRTDFNFQIDKNQDGADGITFTIQTAGTDFLGSDGRDLGYGKTTGTRSVAIAFDQYNYYEYGSKFGFAANGSKPDTESEMSPLDLHGGDMFHVTATYDGKMLRVAVTDLNDSTKVFGASEHINLVSALGSSRAFVGFTAATGANRSTQTIGSWSYTGSDTPAPTPPPVAAPSAPTFLVAPYADPARVTGTSTTLTTLASDAIDPAGSLIYKWRVMSMPAGAIAPTFSSWNSSNAARVVRVHFAKDGTYTVRGTVTNTAGLSRSSEVTIRVVQTATSIALSPHRVSLKVNQRVQFSATLLDQFGHAMRTQPSFSYGLQSGAGKITASGMYIAPSDIAHVIVEATADGFTGVAGLTVHPKDVPPPVSA